MPGLEPVTLQGIHVRLEPLTVAHHEGLVKVGLDPELWRLIPTQIHDAAGMRAYIEAAIRQQDQGTSLPFATIDAKTNEPLGSTRYMNIDLPNRRAEIGSTWIAPRWQRTAINTEAKYLMLKHAFETLNFIRVELKTDELNERSRNAILRIGAKQEGLFRSHVICDTGRIRNTVYFSIIASEWPAVKANLEQKLSRPLLS